jgi:carbamoyl-phosphate synthase large subunit
MAIAYSDDDVRDFITEINKIHQEHPILVDKYMIGKELEVDAICDGEDVLIPGIMEHLERAGIHSGDSISVYPTQNISEEHQQTIIDYTTRIAKELNVIGMINVQFIICKGQVYIIEVNPRSSRTVPYISKVTNLPVIDIATECILGKKLKDMKYGTGIFPRSEYIAIKMPVFSFEKLKNAEISLGPEMKSTGEVLGISKNYSNALHKAFLGTGIKIPNSGNVLITVRDKDKEEVVPVAQALAKHGFNIYATSGTAAYFDKYGIKSTVIQKLWEGQDNILHLIQSGKINFVINTPNRSRKVANNTVVNGTITPLEQKKEVTDGFRIRRTAVECKIPCFTAIDTVVALLDSINHNRREEEMEVVDITEV